MNVPHTPHGKVVAALHEATRHHHKVHAAPAQEAAEAAQEAAKAAEAEQ